MNNLALIEIEQETLQFKVGVGRHLAHFSMKDDYKCLNKARRETLHKSLQHMKQNEHKNSFFLLKLMLC